MERRRRRGGSRDLDVDRCWKTLSRIVPVCCHFAIEDKTTKTRKADSPISCSHPSRPYPNKHLQHDIFVLVYSPDFQTKSFMTNPLTPGRQVEPNFSSPQMRLRGGSSWRLLSLGCSLRLGWSGLRGLSWLIRFLCAFGGSGLCVVAIR